MRWIRIGVSVVLVLLIVLLGSALIIVGSAQHFLYPSVYQKAFATAGVNDLLDAFDANKSALGNAALIRGEIRGIANTALIEALAYIRGERNEPNISVEIETERIRQHYETEAEKFPVCSPGQEEYAEKEVVCRQRDKNISHFIDEALARNNISILQNNNINLLDTFDKDRNIVKAREIVRKAHTGFFIVVLVEAVLLFLLFLLWRTDKRVGLRWIGVSILLAALLAIALALVLQQSLTEQLAKQGVSMQDREVDLPTGIDAFDSSLGKKIGGVIAFSLLDSLFSRVELVGGIVALIGVCVFGVSWTIKSKIAA